MERVKLENIAFPPEFFEDEVREGFFISSMMKRFWAGQIKFCPRYPESVVNMA